MRLHPPLALEVAAARGVAALSRRLGAGGGTTIPGKLLAELDRGAIDRLAARLATGTAVVSATNGKTTTTAMAAEILRPPKSLAERAYTDIRRWTVMPQGGHFAAMEQPEALAHDIREFFRPLRNSV